MTRLYSTNVASQALTPCYNVSTKISSDNTTEGKWVECYSTNGAVGAPYILFSTETGNYKESTLHGHDMNGNKSFAYRSVIISLTRPALHGDRPTSPDISAFMTAKWNKCKRLMASLVQAALYNILLLLILLLLLLLTKKISVAFNIITSTPIRSFLITQIGLSITETQNEGAK